MRSSLPKDYLAREGQARTVYPAEIDRWYAFLRENHEPVATLVVKANELAAKHNLTSLRPLAVTPMVLELRDEELAEKEKASFFAEVMVLLLSVGSCCLSVAAVILRLKESKPLRRSL